MAELAELTREASGSISNELLGQNRDYRLLKTPANPAYPRGDERMYADEFITQLNERFPLSGILGTRMRDIADGESSSIARIVRGSPLKNMEGENILAHMLMNSAQAGEWQPFVIDVPHLTDAQSIETAQAYLAQVQATDPAYKNGRPRGGLLFGLAVAQQGGFAKILEHDNKVMVVPSQSFVEYIAQKK